MSIPEVEAYIDELRALRAEMLKWCDGLSADALNWKPPVNDTNSLFQILSHVAGSDAYWIQQVIGGVDVGRNREAEFSASGPDLALLKAQIAENERRDEHILHQLTETDMTTPRQTTQGPHDPRWCIVHIVEHWSRHVGHAELTRQLWESMGQAT